jgi:hypothetical protein
MMNTIAQRLLESVSWGLKLRLYSGAALSVADMLSDINVIYLYMRQGEAWGFIMLVLVALNMSVQIMVTYLQNRHLPRKVRRAGERASVTRN